MIQQAHAEEVSVNATGYISGRVISIGIITSSGPLRSGRVISFFLALALARDFRLLSACLQ